MKSPRSIIAFTDGASSGNPGPGGWGAIVITPGGQVTELGGGERHTTNNRMEMQAVISALEFLDGVPGVLEIHTDSTYVRKGITEWAAGWIRRGWRTSTGQDVLNRDLWERMIALADARDADDRIRWHQVAGHSGHPGNERADEIAVAYTQGREPDLYCGPLPEYGVPVLDVPGEEAPGAGPGERRRVVKRAGGTARPAGKARSAGASRSRSRKPAYSYLSVVNGAVKRHATWAECERRVHGLSDVRFRKALSESDEREILREWGFRPEDVTR